MSFCQKSTHAHAHNTQTHKLSFFSFCQKRLLLPPRFEKLLHYYMHVAKEDTILLHRYNCIGCPSLFLMKSLRMERLCLFPLNCVYCTSMFVLLLCRTSFFLRKCNEYGFKGHHLNKHKIASLQFSPKIDHIALPTPKQFRTL